MVTHYRGVRSNNIINDNHAVLAERFQPSMLYKLRQLGLYNNSNTTDAAHQLDAETVAAEVTYTTINTQLRCLRGGESDRVPSTFKEAMGLPHTRR